MKKFLLSVSLVICIFGATARPVVMKPSEIRSNTHKSEIPTVDQNGDVITISTDSVTEAHVYIKDMWGNVLTTSSLVLSPNGDQVIVPEERINDMFTIEVHTENDTFTGNLDN